MTFFPFLSLCAFVKLKESYIIYITFLLDLVDIHMILSILSITCNDFCTACQRLRLSSFPEFS